MVKAKRQTEEFLKCKHCGNFAPMDIVADYYLSTKPEYNCPEDDYYDPDSDAHPQPEQGYTYELLFCLACKKVTLQEYFDHDSLEPEDIKVETLYPFQGVKLFYLPLLIQEAYEAALKARSIDANAYAMLLGRMLELVCENREAKGEKLHQKLKFLAEKGKIPSNLVSIANGIRELRNIGTHQTLEGLSSDEIPILDDLSRAILEYIYVAPGLAKQAERRWNQLKKKPGAERIWEE